MKKSAKPKKQMFRLKPRGKREKDQNSSEAEVPGGGRENKHLPPEGRTDNQAPLSNEGRFPDL